MGSPWHLLATAVSITGLVFICGISSAKADAGDCGSIGVATGACGSVVHGGISGDGVVLGGEATHRGGTPGGPTSHMSGPVGQGPGAQRDLVGGRRTGDSCSPILGCGFLEQVPEEIADQPEASVADVTIRDVASFAPGPVADEMEPGWGIAVRRLPANFISGATEQVVEGMLLGRPAAVRFTPVGFGWDTGDGGRVEASTAGATWERLGQKELTDTATSHRYEERGFYDVQPTVTYAAEYRFDGSAWIPVVGTLDVAGAPYRVRVVTVETRLTRGDCIRYPNDPGCK